MDAPIAVADPDRGQLFDALAQWGLVRLAAAIAHRAPMGDDHPAGAPLADAEADPEEVHRGTPLGRPHQFFLSTSWSICLSRVKSATSCFRRRFSSSTSRNLRSSAIPIPANFRFQR